MERIDAETAQFGRLLGYSGRMDINAKELRTIDRHELPSDLTDQDPGKFCLAGNNVLLGLPGLSMSWRRRVFPFAIFCIYIPYSRCQYCYVRWF